MLPEPEDGPQRLRDEGRGQHGREDPGHGPGERQCRPGRGGGLAGGVPARGRCGRRPLGRDARGGGGPVGAGDRAPHAGLAEAHAAPAATAPRERVARARLVRDPRGPRGGAAPRGGGRGRPPLRGGGGRRGAVPGSGLALRRRVGRRLALRRLRLRASRACGVVAGAALAGPADCAVARRACDAAERVVPEVVVAVGVGPEGVPACGGDGYRGPPRLPAGARAAPAPGPAPAPEGPCGLRVRVAHDSRAHGVGPALEGDGRRVRGLGCQAALGVLRVGAHLAPLPPEARLSSATSSGFVLKRS